VSYVNASDVPWIAAMRPSAQIASATGSPRSGATVYGTYCAGCHGNDRHGKDRAPSLIDVGRRLSLTQIGDVIEHGRGFMPSFARMRQCENVALLAYLTNIPEAEATDLVRVCAARERPQSTTTGSRYEFLGYERWRDSSGYPVIKPPWGTLSAIDLNTGLYLWRIPLGEYKELTAKGVPITGTEQYGGPIVTAGGIVFIAATQDGKFRAFDKSTGKLLWQTTLPAAGYATPSTYSVRGKQYVVIAAGGGKLGTKSGDAYVAFALP